MLLWVGMKAAVLMAVAMHHTKLIQVLRSAVRAHPGHSASDASAQTFAEQNCVASQARTRSSLKPTITRVHSPICGKCTGEVSDSGCEAHELETRRRVRAQ